MAKRLILCFDGTWNTPDKNDVDGDQDTNVCKIYEAILPADAAGMEQRAWYDQGVGTRWFNRVRGGAFGVGLSQNIQDGYRFLVRNYQEGDELFLLGFSRGAYTARSLVGLIRNAGLVWPQHERMTPQAYSLYRTRDKGADSESARFFRDRYSRIIPIKFLGVWDTVGALGIPLRSFQWFNREYYQFHDTELSGIVENAFQAIAIDEHRKNYQPAIWDPREKPHQRIEQVWFAGAHSNVGGGYPDRELSDITLRWMAQKAQECGLALDPEKLPEVEEKNYLASVRDSFEEFLKGIYGFLADRYYRPIGTARFGAERFDESVKVRWEKAKYKPRNEMGEHVDRSWWE